MPVTIVSKKQTDPNSLSSLLGLTVELANLLEDNGIKLAVSTHAVRFIKGGQHIASYILPKPLAVILSGDISAIQKMMMVNGFSVYAHGVIKNVLGQGFGSGVVLSTNEEVPAPVEPANVDVAAKLTQICEDKYADPVPLSEATMLYQPVRGTSEGSRYFVVAMNKDVKVAARINGLDVSIRVEGDFSSKKLVNAFVSVGVKLKSGAAYMSGHFNCGSNVTPNRVIGAILLGTGLAFDTPMPDLNKIV